ncbi:MAG: ribosomal RNA small subunit methyltransferase A [Kofleriaceae bacterium]|nr:ribosomal RNA small subunit methyltransferase A [Kofleriaceae bacterium]MCL4224096.1 ribosomal RNA small subunit methyltransferase A [Myxococcales bacterium]
MPDGGPAFPDARTLLERHGLRAKKHFGQNFLTSERVFRAIVDATVRADDDWIVEVGAGLGTLTARLAERVPEGKVIALERDPDMVGVLTAELGHLDNIHIEACDALRYDLTAVARWHGGPITVCGNLPYHIAAPILFKTCAARADVGRGVFMVQKEMADRIVAGPGTKTYGALGVMLQSYAACRLIAVAPAGAFTPAPKVDSAVVLLDFTAPPALELPEEEHHRAVVHAAFGQRRKTLRNALRAVYAADAVAAALAATGIDGGRRGETLSLAELAAVGRALPAAAQVGIVVEDQA